MQLPDNVATLAVAEDDAIASIRAANADLAPPPPEVAALLAILAQDARAAVEVGTGGGVTGMWLLRGMPERGILTSLEGDRDVHDRVGTALSAAAADGRARSIHGDPLTVLGRLTDDGYQLVLLQTGAHSYPTLLDEVRRVLAPGGVLVARGVLRAEAADEVATLIDDLRPAAQTLTVLPVDDGLLVARL